MEKNKPWDNVSEMRGLERDVGEKAEQSSREVLREGTDTYMHIHTASYCTFMV